MAKKDKKSKPLYSKKYLAKHFTASSPRHILPEDVTVHSIYVSKGVDKGGNKILYSSGTNTEWRIPRTEIVSFTMSVNDNEHKESLHAE